VPTSEKRVIGTPKTLPLMNADGNGSNPDRPEIERITAQARLRAEPLERLVSSNMLGFNLSNFVITTA
jgi:hypothetical protein